jgi:hypothetical protein
MVDAKIEVGAGVGGTLIVNKVGLLCAEITGV